MRYFYIPGRSKGLSKVELEKVLNTFELKNYNISVKEKFFLVDTKDNIQIMERVFAKLGGFLSFGLVYEDIDNLLTEYTQSEKKGKVVFGISVFTDNPSKYSDKKMKELYEYIKDYFSQNDVSSRYVMPTGLQLGTGQVLRTKMLEKGFELVIMEDSGKLFYGKTLGIQDIDMYSAIEFDKPFTDKNMGVLPAKLAKIMINLAQVPTGGTIWDPFCGSGTTLLMGLLSGLNVLGSDIDPQAVAGSIKNIEWLASFDMLGDLKYEVFELDVLKNDWKTLSLMKKTEVNAIVCEPYMGPPQFKPLSETHAKKQLGEVESLYKGLFEVISETKKRDTTIVMIVPSYKTYSGWVSLSLNSILPKRWVIEKVGEEGDLHWRRSNSIIKRNIFIVKAKSS